MNLFLKRPKQNPLHEAILSNRIIDIQEEWLQEKNDEGFTPVDIAELLNRKDFLRKLSPHEEERLYPVEKDGVIEEFTRPELEKLMNFEYLPSLEVSKYSIIRKIVRKCEKAKIRGIISREQKWLGSYYASEISKHREVDSTIRWIDNVFGFGLFTNQDLKKRDYVGEYTGVLRRHRPRADKNNCYCFEYVIGERVRTPYTIDAQDKGNLMRFINHSDKGNVDPMFVFSGNIMHVIIYANRPIQKGEQLTYDYGPEYWAKREDPVD